MHVHFEVVIAQLLWVENEKWRLLKDRNKIEPQYISVQSVPSRESWILGLGFSKPKQHLLLGLLTKGNYAGIFDKIMLGTTTT